MKCLKNKNGRAEIEIIFEKFKILCRIEDAGKDKEVIFNNKKMGTLRCPYDY